MLSRYGMDQQCLCDENWYTLKEIFGTGTDHARYSLFDELATLWYS